MSGAMKPESGVKPVWSHAETAIRVSSLDGCFDFRLFRPETNFGAGGLARTLVEIDRAYSDQGVVWQGEVYAEARAVFLRRNSRRIVDFGTGAGAKFKDIFAGLDAERIQIDWDDRRETIDASTGPEASRFITANLEDAGDLERVAAELAGGPPTVFLLSDVIEHLLDPRPLLRVLRRLLRDDPGNRLIISTPDRDLIDGLGSKRLPDNLGHVRQWTLNEFGLALLSAGFDIVRIGHVKQNQYDRLDRTIIAEATCTLASYDRFLAQNHLPFRSDHVAITTEHASSRLTGGIGSYHLYSDEACGTNKIYLYVGAAGLPPSWLSFVHSKRWIHVAQFSENPPDGLDGLSNYTPDEILSALQHIVFIYDEVRLVEYQDYLGIGMRVAQAKRAGLLPPTITVCAYAHGDHFYLDNASGALLDVGRSLEIDVRERISLEQADVVLFPSKFLHDLYSDAQGLRFRDVRYQAYPIQFKRGAASDLARRPIDTLLFYGKQSPQKGYPEFCDAVVGLFDKPGHGDVAQQIKRLVLLGVTDPDPRLLNLPHVEVTHGIYPLDEVVSIIQANASRALAVLPYKGDNHPLSIFEVVDADCQILMFDAGGVPEILPVELHGSLLCRPNAAALEEGIARAVNQPFWDRTLLLDETWRLMKQRYDVVTREYKATIDSLKRSRMEPRPARGAVSVIIPNLNGDRHFFEDLALGLRNSFLRPACVQVVDDGSDKAGRERLEDGLQRLGDVPHEVTFNAQNLGLAGARNVGLAKLETPYVCAHDNDNILLNRYLDIACRILDENPDVAAVTAWSWAFKDGESWRARRAAWAFEYRPWGQDLGAMLRANAIGDAFAVYRTEAIRDLGGWDGSSKAMLEDWELFTRMTVAGLKIWVLPQPMFLYRLRANSMLQTYARMPGELRLAHALYTLAPADAVSVVTAFRKFDKEAGLLRQREAELAQSRASVMKAIASRARGILSIEADLTEQRQERFKAIARRASTWLRFEGQLAEERRERLKAVAANAITRFDLEAGLAEERRERLKEMARRARLQLASEAKSNANWLDASWRMLKPGPHSRQEDHVNPDPNSKEYKNDRRLVEISGLFDAAWYLRTYADLSALEGSPLDHYMQHGGLEGRCPGPLFDGGFYLRTYKDIADAKLNPLVHFLRHGADEGRLPGPYPQTW